MAVTLPYKQPRGTRAALDALKTAAGLIAGLMYCITDESYRVAVATGTGAYSDMALRSDVPPKGLEFFCSGKPTANEVVGGGIAPYALTLVQANCTVKSLVAATASTTLIIKKNGTQIGTIVFAAAGTTATVTITTAAVAKGDNITIHGPATPDATLADITGLLSE